MIQLRDRAPDWVVVVAVSGVVGAVSAILAVVVYRDLVNQSDQPIEVENESQS